MRKILYILHSFLASINNYFIIRNFISQIRFIDHVYRKEEDLFIIKLDVKKFPFRLNSLSAATLTSVKLSEFLFFIENEHLVIRFNDDELDRKLSDFPCFINIENTYLNERSYLYRKVKKSLIPIIKEVKCRNQIHQNMIDFHNRLKDIEPVDGQPVSFSLNNNISSRNTL